MFEFEVVVVVVGLGAEADLLDDDFDGLGFDLLGFLLLLVEELLVVDDAAYRRFGLGRDLHQVEFLFLRHAKRFGQRIDVRPFDIIAHKPYLRCRDLPVDSVRVLFLHASPERGPRRSGAGW